jgi:hypothetical protein
MRKLALLTSLLCAGPALAQTRPLGNTLDIGEGYSNAPELQYTTSNGTVVQYVAARFTAHQALPVRRAAIGIASFTNHSNPASTFDLLVCPDAAGGPDLANPIFTGSFTGADIPRSGRALLVVGPTITGGVPLSSVPNQPYYVVVRKTALGDSFKALGAPLQSDVDPVSSVTEPAPRALWSGTATRTGINFSAPSWTDTGLEPIFAVEYSADLQTCPVASQPACEPVDGTTYLSAAFFTIAQNEYVAEVLSAARVLPAVPERVFALQMAASHNTTPTPHLGLTNLTGQVVADAPSTDTGVTYRSNTYHQFLGIFTSADAGAITLDPDGGSYAAVTVNLDGTKNLFVPSYNSGDGNPASINDRGQYLGGSPNAYAQVLNGGTASDIPSQEVPFQLCGSEILGNGIDEDCSGEDETDAGALFTACHDHDQDGFGDPSDRLELSRATWLAQPPAGYVADCTDCNDNDPLVHTCPSSSGSTGSAASTGSTGSSASTGSTSSSASTGSTGSTAGSTGSTAGSTSSTASTGSSSSTASTGSTGSSASTGSTSSGSSTGSTSSSASTASTGSTAGSTGSSASTGSTGSSASTGSTGSSASTGSTGTTGHSTGSAAGSIGGAGSSGQPGPAKPASFDLAGGCGCQSVADPGLAFLGLALLWRRRPRGLRR